MIIILTTFCFVFYVYIMFFINRGLNKLRPKKINYQKHFFSIIVPARNEESSIANFIDSILQQSYDSNMFEIIVIDDRSEDETSNIVLSYQKNHKNIHLIKQNHVENTIAPKKKALIQGIEKASGEIIITSDADCVFEQFWLENINSYYCNEIDVLCAPVTFKNGKNKIFTSLQELDFLSLIATSAGAIGMKQPVICNGANFSFRQSAFIAMDGYNNLPNVSSGEDDQLLYKFYNNKFKIGYCWKYEALAKTTPIENFKDFLNQRKRWGSMEVKNDNDVWKFRLYGIYLLNFSLLLLMISSLFYRESAFFFIQVLTLKFLVELPIISKVIKLVRKPKLWFLAPFIGILQVPYVAIVGALANVTPHSWKE